MYATKRTPVKKTVPKDTLPEQGQVKASENDTSLGRVVTRRFKNNKPDWNFEILEDTKKKPSVTAKFTRSKPQRVVEPLTSRTSPIRTRSSPPKPDTTPIDSATKPVAFSIAITPVSNKNLRRSPRLNSTPVNNPANTTQVIHEAVLSDITVNIAAKSNGCSDNSNIESIDSDNSDSQIPEPPIVVQPIFETAIEAEPYKPISRIETNGLSAEKQVTVPEPPLSPIVEIKNRQTSTKPVEENLPVTNTNTVVADNIAPSVSTVANTAVNTTEPQYSVDVSTTTELTTGASAVIKVAYSEPLLTTDTPSTPSVRPTPIWLTKTDWFHLTNTNKNSITKMAEKDPVTITFKSRCGKVAYSLKDGDFLKPYKAFQATYEDLPEFDSKGNRDNLRKESFSELEKMANLFRNMLKDMSDYSNICFKQCWDIPSMDHIKMRVQDCQIIVLERLQVLKQLEIQKMEEQKDTVIQRMKVADKKAARDHVDSCLSDPQPSTSKSTGAKPKSTQKSSDKVSSKRVPVEESSTEESENEDGDTSTESSSDDSGDSSDSGDSDPPPRRKSSKKIPQKDLVKLLSQLQKQVKDLKKKSGQKRKPAPMTVQAFGGEKADYLRFKTAFKSVYEDVGLTPIELAIRLGELLKGEPKSKFSWMADDANKHTYKQMWANLDIFYGTREKHEMSKLEKFNRMPDVKVFNAPTVQLLYATLTMNWKVLKDALKGDFSKEDNHLFYPFLKKLPYAEVVRYKENCLARNLPRTFRSFKNWLLEQYNYLSEDKEKTKDRTTADQRLVYWHQDRCLETETRGLAMLALDREGDELTIVNNDCSITVEDDGTPSAYLEPKIGSLLLYKDGQFQRVQKLKVPASALTGAPVKPKSGFRDPNKTIMPKPKQKELDFAVCVFCTKQGHLVHQCTAFAKASMKVKMTTVKENKLCFRCLNKGHIARDCKVRFLCDIDNCGKRHHRLMHPESNPSKSYYAIVCHQGLASDISDCESDD